MKKIYYACIVITPIIVILLYVWMNKHYNTIIEEQESNISKLEHKNLQIEKELNTCKLNYQAVADQYLGEGNYEIK